MSDLAQRLRARAEAASTLGALPTSGGDDQHQQHRSRPTGSTPQLSNFLDNVNDGGTAAAELHGRDLGAERQRRWDASGTGSRPTRYAVTVGAQRLTRNADGLGAPADRRRLRRHGRPDPAREHERAPGTSATSTSSTAQSIRPGSESPAADRSRAPRAARSPKPGSSATGPSSTTPTGS